MTSPLPPIEFDARPVTPAGFGLFDAATIIEVEGASRHLGGVNITPINCDLGYGTWPNDDLCDTPDDLLKEAERAEVSDTFLPVTVWAADECGTGITEAEASARAQHLLALRGRLLVETAFATRLLADSPAPTVVDTVVDAIGTLEEFLGNQGYLGYLHSARRFAAAASQYRWGNQTSAPLRSPLSHTWVFGGGYSGVLADSIVATGPVYLWRDAVTVRTVTDPLTNRVYAMAEQSFVVGYECAILEVTVTPPA